jgi:hypothetical protein
MALKEDYRGSGAMVETANQLNKIAHALNNVRVKMPVNYTGKPASGRIENGELVIDLMGVDFSQFV